MKNDITVFLFFCSRLYIYFYTTKDGSQFSKMADEAQLIFMGTVDYFHQRGLFNNFAKFQPSPNSFSRITFVYLNILDYSSKSPW